MGVSRLKGARFHMRFVLSQLIIRDKSISSLLYRVRCVFCLTVVKLVCNMCLFHHISVSIEEFVDFNCLIISQIHALRCSHISVSHSSGFFVLLQRCQSSHWVSQYDVYTLDEYDFNNLGSASKGSNFLSS